MTALVQAVRVDTDAEANVEIGAQLRRLYDEHYRSLVKLAAFYVDDVGSCEEVVQDAFVALLGRERRVTPGKEAAYLRSAVLNGARSALRKRRVRRQQRDQAVPFPASPEATAVAATERGEVLAVIRNLPAKQADVVVLRYWFDLSEAEIAQTLGMARGTVKSHSHRALKTLAERLEDHR